MSYMRNIFALYTKISLKLQQLVEKVSFIIRKKVVIVLFLSLIPYLLFFGKLILPNNVIYSGKDSNAFHYQSKVYLSEKLKNNEYPFWTEKMFLGFPIYADMERGYLNPINVILVKYFGPFYSYKILHIVCYLLGSLSFYYFLKKYNVNYLGYFIANLIYYFSLFSFYHQQHFNMILTYYLFPVGLFLLDIFVKEDKFRYALFNTFLLSFCFYLGSFQFVFIFILLELIYLISILEKITLYSYFKRFGGFLIYSFSWFFILILPGLLSTYSLYTVSSRSSSLDFIQGSYSPAMLINIFFPFIFNLSDKFMGSYASKDYFIHEIYIYIGLSTIITSFISYFNLKIKDLVIKRFINILIVSFFILGFLKYVPIINSINFLPFSLFRYWGRSVVFLNLAISILVGIYLSLPSYTYYNNLNLSSFFSFKNKNLKNILYIVFYLLILETFSIIKLFPFSINIKNSSFFNLLSILNRHDYIFEYWYFIWFLVLSFFIFILFSKTYVIKRYRSVFLSIIIIFDILVFGFIATKDSLIKNTNDLFPRTKLPGYIRDTTSGK
ncbi:MAG: YfhO family protein, partial [Magnetococcus sp. XQGC-1]